MEQHNNNQNTNGNINFPKRTCLTCGKTDEAIDSCETCKPKGMLGWVCPVCGMGNSPFSSVCPCKSMAGQITYCAPGFPTVSEPIPTITEPFPTTKS